MTAAVPLLLVIKSAGFSVPGHEHDLNLSPRCLLDLLHDLVVLEVRPECTALLSQSNNSALSITYYPHMLQRHVTSSDCESEHSEALKEGLKFHSGDSSVFLGSQCLMF